MLRHPNTCHFYKEVRCRARPVTGADSTRIREIMTMRRRIA
jgi:hypothetical protein